MKQNWQYKKLGDCFSSIGNGANIKQFTPAEGFPITRIETLSNNNFNRDKLGYANIFDISKYSNNILENGDILMSHINSVKYLGRAVLYKKNGNETIIHGMNLLRLVPISNIVTSTFAQYLFKSFYFRSQILRIAKKAVNQASFTTSDLKKLIIPVPPIEEQERIVAELDLLSGIIEKQKQQLKELDNFAQSIFYSMFGDPISNEKNWEIKKLGEVVLLKSGDSKANNFPDGKIPYVKVGDMNLKENQMCITTSSRFIKINNDNKNIFPVGTTIFPKRGGAILTNKKRITKINICCDLNIMGAIPNLDYLNPLFLFYFFKIAIDFSKLLNGSSVPQINNLDIYPIKIPIPPISLQNEFAEKIEKIEKQKEAINKSIEETQKLFDYTMDKYFG